MQRIEKLERECEQFSKHCENSEEIKKRNNHLIQEGKKLREQKRARRVTKKDLKRQLDLEVKERKLAEV